MQEKTTKQSTTSPLPSPLTLIPSSYSPPLPLPLPTGEDDEMTNYVLDLLPRIKAAHPEIPILEFIQEPGDTVFVPGGWWHGVLNLDNTLAITQNYCSRANFDQVWRKTRSGRKKMSVSWLRRLHQHVPDLAQRAIELNEEDGFVMYDMEKRRAEKIEKQRMEKDKEKGMGQEHKERNPGGGSDKKPIIDHHHHHDHKKKNSGHRDKKRKDKDESTRHDDTSLSSSNSNSNSNSNSRHIECVEGNEYTRDMKKMRVQ